MKALILLALCFTACSHARPVEIRRDPQEGPRAVMNDSSDQGMVWGRDWDWLENLCDYSIMGRDCLMGNETREVFFISKNAGRMGFCRKFPDDSVREKGEHLIMVFDRDIKKLVGTLYACYAL